MRRQDRRLGDVELLEQRGVRLGEAEDDGLVVDRLDRGDVAADGAGRAGVQRGEDLVERVDDVGGGEGLPVVPGHVVAQREGVGRTVVGDLPGLGQLGLRLTFGIELDEAVEHELRRRVGATTGRDRRVEAAWVARDGGHERATGDRLGRGRRLRLPFRGRRRLEFAGSGTGFLAVVAAARSQQQADRHEQRRPTMITSHRIPQEPRHGASP